MIYIVTIGLAFGAGAVLCGLSILISRVIDYTRGGRH